MRIDVSQSGGQVTEATAEGLVGVLGGIFLWFVSPAIARFQSSGAHPVPYKRALVFARVVAVAVVAIGLWLPLTK